ncbi:MAG: hypothetical protein H0V29_01565 [Thermoleophilaceae bacterium]|nr:hypothetical protein [Thermoleophilaceae bacterium]
MAAAAGSSSTTKCPGAGIDKGEELSDLGVEEDSWNGVAAADGTLALGVVSDP